MSTTKDSDEFDASSFVNDLNVGFCAKSPEGRVLFQNERCKAICGDRRGRICKDGCMEYYREQREETQGHDPALWYPKRMMGSRWYDILFLKTQKLLVTLLYPKGGVEDPCGNLEELGLTRRELEIAALLRKGYSNREISKKLFISVATLKTHLNNIYYKLGPERRGWLRPLEK